MPGVTTGSLDKSGEELRTIARSEEDIEEAVVRPSPSARTPSSSDWFKDRFMRRGKRKIGTMESLRAIVTSSGLNLLVVFIPVSWAFHFTNHQNPDDPTSVWPFEVTFAISLLALVPLEKSLEYGGDQISLYCGKEIGDLIIVTLNNAVEATLAIILLVKCELRILQSTIIGVILLHLLLVPGVAFIIGGAKLIYQSLNQHSAQLNHILLLMGVLTLVLPTALYATLQNSSQTDTEISKKLLDLSHVLVIVLLVVYAYSRVFLYNPPGGNNALRPLPDAPIELIEEERKLLEEEPEVNQWVCIAFLLATIAVMAPTAEWLVDSVDVFNLDTHIQPEFFGLIILPLVSFTADALLAVGYFIRTTVRYCLGSKPPPTPVAKARSIDISIQFNLFWLPLIILLGWWTNRPITLLFDAFEVAILIGAAVEATLAIILLVKCEVLTLVLPTALYATLQNSSQTDTEISKKLLDLSHVLVIVLLVVYAYSRVFLYNPPGGNNALRPLPDAPIELIEEERKLLEEEPEVNQWVHGSTAEWLVDSVDVFNLDTHIQPEYLSLPESLPTMANAHSSPFRFFGLIILPLVSFTADALLAVGYFIRTTVRYCLGSKPPPTPVAKARSIDISIQFNLFWLPLIILLGWWTNRPITLLFDAFEVAILIGACFLVNFVTADAKTNWAEGATMVSFYIMIAILTAWFYVGNTAITDLLQGGKCVESG
ncbi:hypothetical protein BT96DRAFT_942184 [Gymnopus androsaceus JB14]|uniref:Sodium/calcium exchanger membrane region domain-containing protein n=1 Tax=Gymnopus androsaceus JB14 TaxID=1447944 RepID=A0A6A4HEV6_9AGAR|nr:hypothetical protein BT96DRAFT_942184 [Gymnopus androsaceus JB14]